MPEFQVRVLGAYDERRDQVDSVKFAMGAESVLVYEHTDQSRIHIHIYLFGCVYKIDKLRKECQRFFTGNSQYAIKSKAGKDGKPIEYEGAVRYGSKEGTYHFKLCVGFDPVATTMLEEKYKKQPKYAVKHKSCYADMIETFDRDNVTLKETLVNVVYDPRNVSDPNIYAMWHALKRRVKQYVFLRNESIWSPKAWTEYKVLAVTWAMRNGIAIDPADKFAV